MDIAISLIHLRRLAQFPSNSKQVKMRIIITCSVWLFAITLMVTISVTHQELSPFLMDEDMNKTTEKKFGSDELKIFFYNADISSEGVQVDITDEEAMKNTSFSASKRSFFIIHGWKSSGSKKISTSLKDAFLATDDVNVFVVDWSSFSMQLYAISFAFVQPIGELLASMIRALESNNNLDLSKTAIVGHSLGAHISGVTGYNLNGQIDYIVGMDPAGPLFIYDEISVRLSPSSAQFVQVIHTCGSELGFYKPLGLTDYYPNGGLKQNGCGFDITGICSHSRSYLYYAESIVSGNFVAQRCDSYDDYENGKCNGTKSMMGGYNLDKSARGSFYLDTNGESPFAKSDAQ